MGRFDLNNSVDFARATNSFGASTLQLFTGRGNSSWQIDEGSYQSGVDASNIVIFHVFRSALDYDGALSQVTDAGGRRKAKFVFPYLDGQLLEDMGRKAETFTLEIVLHGNNYLEAFNNLITLLNEPTPGILTHPVRGQVTCAMEDYQILHEEKSRKSLAISLTMIEHSTSGLALRRRENNSAKSKLSKLTEAFKKFENAINAVQGAIFLAQSVKNGLIAAYEELQAKFASITGEMNATFNPGGNIPALLPTQLGGLQGPNGTIIGSGTNVALSVNDPFVNLPPTLANNNLQTALAVEQLSKDIDSIRTDIGSLINDLSASGLNRGSLEFYQNIIDLRVTANELQAAFEAGKASSRVRLIKFVTERVMSVREVAFENGLSPDDGFQVSLLNPELGSLNLIPIGTELKIAVS